MKIRPVGDELFHADRQTDGETDMTKLIVAFCNFANTPENRNCNYTSRASVSVLACKHSLISENENFKSHVGLLLC